MQTHLKIVENSGFRPGCFLNMMCLSGQVVQQCFSVKMFLSFFHTAFPDKGLDETRGCTILITK